MYTFWPVIQLINHLSLTDLHSRSMLRNIFPCQIILHLSSSELSGRVEPLQIYSYNNQFLSSDKGYSFECKQDGRISSGQSLVYMYMYFKVSLNPFLKPSRFQFAPTQLDSQSLCLSNTSL